MEVNYLNETSCLIYHQFHSTALAISNGSLEFGCKSPNIFNSFKCEVSNSKHESMISASSARNTSIATWGEPGQGIFPVYLASCYNNSTAEDHREGAKFSALITQTGSVTHSGCHVKHFKQKYDNFL